jgi:hypothetical protein
VTVLPEQVFARALEVIDNYTKQDEDTLKAWVDPHQLKKHQGIWYKDGRQVVTGDIKAKRHLIQSHHDSPVHRHPGISKTTQLTERLYWWPQMRKDIMEYVKGCVDCQCHKVNTRPTKAPLVTDLQGPPSERTPEEKLWDFKTRAQQYARDRESCDDVRISYLEFLETEAEDDLALARMIAG